MQFGRSKCKTVLILFKQALSPSRFLLSSRTNEVSDAFWHSFTMGYIEVVQAMSDSRDGQDEKLLNALRR